MTITSKICDLLTDKQIEFELIQHKAVYTIDEMLELNLPNIDLVAKNLFIRDDKKRNYYLLVVRQEKKIDLKELKEKIGSRRLGFASEEDLNSILGLGKGSVTPLGIINDIDNKVKVIFDKYFYNSSIGIHPNENTATIWLKVSDLLKIIESSGNQVDFIEL